MIVNVQKQKERVGVLFREQPTMNLLFDELGPSIGDHIAWYHEMQEKQPVRYRPEQDLWEVFRYKDVLQVLLDYATFPRDASPDLAQHRQRRRLVSKAFTPRRIEKLTPRLSQIVDELLEQAKARGRMNVATSLAYPLPVHTIAELLGLPPSDQELFWQWSYQLLDQIKGVEGADNNELLHYFADLFDERKRDPRDDLISALLVAQEDGTHLTREEIINLCLELILAGNVATSALLSVVIQQLCRHPEIYQVLRDDPSLIPGFIEETLRYYYSPSILWRVAHHDTVFCGQEIKAGQRVVAWTSAANFDEAYFPHSEQFDMRRSPNPQLTFGHGVHICLGAPLARIETRVALERVVAHFSEIHFDLERPLQILDQISSTGAKSFSILFTPAGSLSS